MVTAVALLVLPDPAAASRLWRGQVLADGRPAAGARVTICGRAAAPFDVAAGASHTFEVTLGKSRTRCPVTVTYGNQTTSARDLNYRPFLAIRLRRSGERWLIDPQ